MFFFNHFYLNLSKVLTLLLNITSFSYYNGICKYYVITSTKYTRHMSQHVRCFMSCITFLVGEKKS